MGKGDMDDFRKELSSVMYGFGDSREQLPEALDLMNNIVLEYITGMTNEALRYSYGDEITVQALRCVIRNDLRKDDRVKQLCHMYDKVTEQRDHMHKLKDDIRKEQEQSRNNEPSGETVEKKRKVDASLKRKKPSTPSKK